MIRFLAFDLGDCLFRVDHGQAWEATAARSPLDWETLYARFYRSGAMIESLTGTISDDAFFAQLRDELEFAGRAAELRWIWTDIFSPLDARHQLVAQLAEQYAVGALSNLSRFHRDHLEAHFPLFRRFERKTYSWETGFMKPRPEIFAQCLVGTDFAPEECLFIDDQERHCQAAVALGWQTLHVGPDDDLAAGLKSLLEPPTQAIS